MKKIIALAPMDGITNNAYRTICKHIWDNPQNTLQQHHELYRFTEFMSCEGYVRNPRKLTRHLLTTEGNSKTIAQIYGGNHDNLTQTAVDIDKNYLDFSGIELNIGCPSPKIMACEAGSGMLKCRPKTLQVIQRIHKSINRPFSIKTRAGLHENDKQEQFDFIIEAAYSCSMITIHGRNYKQGHSGGVDRDFITQVKQELIRRDMSNVIIIGNGGLKGASDGLQYLQHLDGIMLGQAAMCSPRALTDYVPNTQELYNTILQHLHLSIANEYYFNSLDCFDPKANKLIQPTQQDLNSIVSELMNGTLDIGDGEPSKHKRFSLIEFRKHLFRYINGLPGNAEFKRTAAQITDYATLMQHIHSYFGLLGCATYPSS